MLFAIGIANTAKFTTRMLFITDDERIAILCKSDESALDAMIKKLLGG